MTVAERLASLLAHRRTGDPESDAILAAICGAIGAAAERLGLAAFGDPATGVDGDGVLRDPSVAPLWALAHAALYTGASLPARRAGEGELAYLARAREEVVYPFGIRRGTHEAIRRVVQPYLTGSKAVFISDSFGDSPYSLVVRTLPEETPDAALIENVLAGSYVSGGQPGAIRAELLLTYMASDAATWQEATLTWGDLPPSVTWNNQTLEDVT